MNFPRLLAPTLFLVLAALILAGCERDEPSRSVTAQGETAGSGVAAPVGVPGDGGWRSLADLPTGGRIGVILGTVMSVHAEQSFPRAQITTLNSTTDQIVAVKNGKVDAGIFDSISARAIVHAHPELAILEEGFLTYPLGIGFRPNRDALRERFDRYLERLRASGGYEEIHRRWFSGDPEQVVMPDYPVQDPKERYVLGVSVADLPYVGFKEGRYIGFDLEILQRFAAEEGIAFEIQSLDFGALIPALAAGKVDLITDGLAITPERAKAVDFSASYGEGQAAAVVLKARLASAIEPQPDFVPSDAEVADESLWRGLDDIAHGHFSVVLGSVFDPYLQRHFPQARITRFQTAADMYLALKSGKVDVAITDQYKALDPLRTNPELGILAGGIGQYGLGVGFRKDSQALRKRFDAFLETLRQDGQLAALTERWLMVDPEHPDHPVIPPPAVPRGKLVAGVVIGDLPYVTLREGQYLGLDIELLQRFASQEGLVLEFRGLDFGSLIPSLVSGKVDLISYGIFITEERLKSIDFSTPYMTTHGVALALRNRMAEPDHPPEQARNPAAGPTGQPEAGGDAAAQGDKRPAGGNLSLQKLAQGRIAVFNGTSQDFFVTQSFPEAEILRFNSTADFVLAVKTGKADAAITESVSIRDIARLNLDLAILADDFYDTPIGAAFRKGDESGLRQRFDRFLAAAREDGTLEDIQRRWLIDQPETVVMPSIPQPETGETFQVGTSYLVGLPYISQADGEPIGHDMELLRRFAAREGLRLEILPMEFDALIASLAVGKIDMIMSRLSITPERQAKVDFSIPYDYEQSAALVLRDNLAALATVSNAPADGAGAGKDRPVGDGGTSPAGGTAGNPPAPRGWRSLDDLARGRIAVFAGAIQDQFVARTYPEAQVIHLTGHADLITSLKTGKVDAGIIIATSAPDILRANPEIGLLGEPILPVPQGAAFRKQDQDLRERFDRFMAAILADGTHAQMRQRWFEGDPHQARMPEIPLPADGPVLRLGTSVFVGLPYVGMVDGDYVGFDIELARRFAAREGMRLVMEPLEFSALIPALTSGKLDLIASALAITPERQKQVAFSTPYAEVSSVVLALKKNLPAGKAGAGQAWEGAGTAAGTAGADQGAGEGGAPPGFLDELRASFHANFVLEQRWKLIFTGLWVTVLISVAATLFGTLLGALVCWLRMSPRPLLRWFGSSYIFLIRGLPVLLLLMLIFYVAFASVNIDPLLVAVIAFGMNFGAYVSEMFRTGIEGVDRGQTEAGIAMGFTRVQTFVHIVLPQAARRILPVYRGEFISLVKMTSIVGYIGVQDLTKAGDIIRSRTFEAFFPLIMVAALYFLVIWVLGLALDHLDRRTDPKRRARFGTHSA